MSTIKDLGEFTFHCDKCSESTTPEDQDDFSDAWEKAKADGWVSFKVKGEWCHYCPACAEEM